MKQERAHKIEKFKVASVDVSKFGRTTAEGILEISHFTNRVRLKLTAPGVSSIPISDEEIDNPIFESCKSLLMRGCEPIALFVLDESTGSYVRSASVHGIII